MHEIERKFLYIFSFISLPHGVVLPFFTTLVIFVALFLATRSLSVARPGKVQNILELIHEKMIEFIAMLVGKDHLRELLPILSTFFIFILFSNLMGLVPGLRAATSIFANCFSLSLIVFFITIYLGLKHHGLGYIKHFTGSIWWLAPLMLPLHIISEIAKPISLTLRLFGNVMGEDLIIMVITAYLIPVLLPLPMYCLSAFMSFLQAAIFTILAGVYFSGAISESH